MLIAAYDVSVFCVLVILIYGLFTIYLRLIWSVGSFQIIGTAKDKMSFITQPSFKICCAHIATCVWCAVLILIFYFAAIIQIVGFLNHLVIIYFCDNKVMSLKIKKNICNIHTCPGHIKKKAQNYFHSDKHSTVYLLELGYYKDRRSKHKYVCII